MTTSTELALSSRGLLRLLQLTSPSFPVGAFAYSQGLEQAVERGWVSDAETLSSWLCGVLSQGLGFTELPLLLRAREAWSQADDSAAQQLIALTLALRETMELRAEEQQLGAALARALTALGIERAAPYVRGARASYVVLFALAALSFEVPPSAMLQGYAFAWAENQVIGATRLISLGQNDAQRVLSAIADTIPEAALHAASIADTDVGRSLVGLCMASSWHEEQYSRLFRS